MENMRKYAIVKFVGNEEEYLIGEYCAGEEWLFCHACQEAGNHKCDRPKIPMFVKGKEYKALKEEYDCFYILDDSSDCYYYPKGLFEVMDDKDGILDNGEV